MTDSMTDSVSELLDKARDWLEKVDELDELLRDPEKGANKKWDAWDAFKPTIVQIRQCYDSLFIEPLREAQRPVEKNGEARQLDSEDTKELRKHLLLLHGTDDALLKDDQRIDPIQSLVDAIIEAAESEQREAKKDQELSEKDQQLSETKASLAEHEKRLLKERKDSQEYGSAGGKKSKGSEKVSSRDEALRDDYSIRKSEFKSIGEYHEQIDARWPDWCKEQELPETTKRISLRRCQEILAGK